MAVAERWKGDPVFEAVLNDGEANLLHVAKQVSYCPAEGLMTIQCIVLDQVAYRPKNEQDHNKIGP